ncbi:MAG: hypothetical protein J5952_02645 [Prevotella sp.]|nr:hypothetical protein [Prevotella sp.]
MRKLKNSVRSTPAHGQRLTASAVLSKLFSYALIAVSVLCVVSCKSQATTPQASYVPPPVAVPTLTPVAVDGDSAMLEARLRADPSGKITLDLLRQETSKRMSLQAQLDSLGNLKVKARRNPDTVYLKGNDSLIYVPVPGPEREVEVNVQSKWQKSMTWLGTAFLVLLAVLGLPKLLKLIRTLLKRY